MKTNRLVLFLSIVMIGFLTSCEKKCNCDDQNFTPPDGTYCYQNNGKPGNMLKYKEIVAMLKHYDKTRKGVLEKALGKEDTRLSTYSIQELKDYLAFIEGVCEEKEIPLTGINIISAAYPKTYEGVEANYQTIIFMPTTTIDGKNTTFDPIKSKKGKPVTFKEMLWKFGYNWPYDGAKDSDPKMMSKKTMQQNNELDDEDSSGSNRLGTKPPM